MELNPGVLNPSALTRPQPLPSPILFIFAAGLWNLFDFHWAVHVSTSSCCSFPHAITSLPLKNSTRTGTGKDMAAQTDVTCFAHVLAFPAVLCFPFHAASHSVRVFILLSSFLQWITSLSDGVLIIHSFFILIKKLYSLDIGPPRAGSMQAPSHLLVLWNPYSAGILQSIILPSLPLVLQLILKGGHLKRESSSSMAYEFMAHCFTLKDILNSKRFLNKDLQ